MRATPSVSQAPSPKENGRMHSGVADRSDCWHAASSPSSRLADPGPARPSETGMRFRLALKLDGAGEKSGGADGGVDVFAAYAAPWTSRMVFLRQPWWVGRADSSNWCTRASTTSVPFAQLLGVRAHIHTVFGPRRHEHVNVDVQVWLAVARHDCWSPAYALRFAFACGMAFCPRREGH